MALHNRVGATRRQLISYGRRHFASEGTTGGSDGSIHSSEQKPKKREYKTVEEFFNDNPQEQVSKDVSNLDAPEEYESARQVLNKRNRTLCCYFLALVYVVCYVWEGGDEREKHSTTQRAHTQREGFVWGGGGFGLAMKKN